MEFKSFNMRTRSSSVSSRYARSATYETSFSVTMMCPSRAVPELRWKCKRWASAQRVRDLLIGDFSPGQTNRESALTIRFLARPCALVPHHKLDRIHRLRADLLQGREILPIESLQLLLPRRVGNLDREHSIRVADRACLLRHLRSARQRPGQQRRVVTRFPPQSVGKDLLQCRAGMLHRVRASIVEQRARSSIEALTLCNM